MSKILEKYGVKFEYLGFFSLSDPLKFKTEGSPKIMYNGNKPKEIGVYLLVSHTPTSKILKVGDTHASKGMSSRIENYISNTGKTNQRMRFFLYESTEKRIDLYFLSLEMSHEKFQLGELEIERLKMPLLPRFIERSLFEQLRRDGEDLLLNPINR